MEHKQANLQFAQEQLNTNMANLEAANSRIIDVDVAKESTNYARQNVLVQSGSAMLAQANGLSSIALQLLDKPKGSAPRVPLKLNERDDGVAEPRDNGYLIMENELHVGCRKVQSK